jgi:hypothetical protein
LINKIFINYLFIIAIYLFTVSILCMLSLIGNVIVLNTHGRDIRIEKDMPIWVSNIIILSSLNKIIKII